VRCRVELRVRRDGREVVTALGTRGGTFVGRSSVLTKGSWSYAVVVRSDASGFGTTRTGSVRVG
jgi:hypothetical protein